jgi:voltage-gated potassium channel Kch
VLGFVAVRLRLPALSGYLLAEVLIGPHTPGFVADVALAAQLAEVGVMLPMFGVGLHFSVDDLMAVRGVALRAEGRPAVLGDASEPAALVRAHVAGAELLVVTATDSTEVRRMIETARRLNPAIPIVVRAPGEEEAQVLREAGAASAVHPREALARVLRQDVVQGLNTARTLQVRPRYRSP